MAVQGKLAMEIMKYAAATSAGKAIKRYGKKAYEEARKHVKDLKTKKKPEQKQTEKMTQGQRTYREGQRKTGVGGAGIGSGVTAATMSSSGEQDYSAANVDLNSGKGLPIADMSETVNIEGTGSGIRYFQNGKEVRLPKGNGKEVIKPIRRPKGN
jgi:hypothetical protein